MLVDSFGYALSLSPSSSPGPSPTTHDRQCPLWRLSRHACFFLSLVHILPLFPAHGTVAAVASAANDLAFHIRMHPGVSGKRDSTVTHLFLHKSADAIGKAGWGYVEW
jgi:hypothetical protein